MFVLNGDRKMKPLISKTGLKFIVLLIAIQILATQISYASGINSISDDIGSKNNTSASEGGSNTATTVLIAGGLLFGAILLYKFVLSKNDKDEDSKKEGDEEKTEESASVDRRNISRLKSELPFEIKLSVQKIVPNLQDRSIVMEVSLPF